MMVFSHFFFSFSLLLEEFFSNFDVRSIFFEKMAWWVKNHQRIVIFRVLGARGFALQNLPETLGIFSSKISQWQTFLAVFLTGKLEDFLVFFFCWGNQEAIYLHHICVCIYIYIQML